jgi:DNA-binding transcriptional LysR family regulator
MDPARLASLDLNLLVILDVLLAERSVTRAARRLRLSQPAVSNALARLRSALGDPLLVRRPHGMAPTPRGLALESPLREALERMGSAIADASGFSAATSRRAFVVAATDYVQFVLLGPLLQRIQESAPAVVLHVVPPVHEFPWQELESGSVDLVIGGAASRTRAPDGLRRRWLFRDRVVCILRAGHPCGRGDFDLERYLSLDHVEALPIGVTGYADQALAAMGRSRRVAVTVPSFLVAPFAVVHSDHCFTLAHRIARPLAESMPLVVRPLPFDAPQVQIGAFWHDRVQDDPAHVWLRRMLIEAAAALDPREVVSLRGTRRPAPAAASH